MSINYTILTAGAVSGVQGGFVATIRHDKGNGSVALGGISLDTTVNRMALTAIAFALREVKSLVRDGDTIVIRTSSKYAAKAVSGGFKKVAANEDILDIINSINSDIAASGAVVAFEYDTFGTCEGINISASSLSTRSVTEKQFFRKVIKSKR